MTAVSTGEAGAFGAVTFTWTRARTVVLLTLCLAQLVQAVDVTIVNVSLHAIGCDVGPSQGDLQWVVNAYAVLLAGLLLLGGRVGGPVRAPTRVRRGSSRVHRRVRGVRCCSERRDTAGGTSGTERGRRVDLVLLYEQQDQQVLYRTSWLTGVSYLPLTAVLMIGAFAGPALVPRIGVR